MLDLGALLASLVGQSEANLRRALRQVDAMSPCVVMVDEVEKALAGAASGAAGDSGVQARLFGSLLTWLNDRDSDSFVVCTANDVARLPPEFARSERCDAIYFLDLPGRAQKDAIWALHQARFGLDPGQRRPADPDWTGAEIRACCRLAALPEVPLAEAAASVVPVAVTAGEAIERLRRWASGRCLDADRPGLYTRGSDAPGARPEGLARPVRQLRPPP